LSEGFEQKKNVILFIIYDLMTYCRLKDLLKFQQQKQQQKLKNHLTK